MKKGQSHPASALSQKLLADGLLSLLEQKPFREITIKELEGLRLSAGASGQK